MTELPVPMVSPSIIRATITLVAFVVASACAGPDGTLPEGIHYGNCQDPPAPPICEWMEASDAVVFGTVEAVSTIDSPVAYLEPESGEMRADGVPERCRGGLSYGLSIELSVSRARGDLSAPNWVTFEIGSSQVGSWSPSAYEEDGELTWAGDQSRTISVGQGLGASLMRVDERWVTGGEVLFATDLGLVSFQYAGCDGTPNGGFLVDDMFSRDCSESDHQARRQFRLRRAASPGVYAAGCGDYRGEGT